MVTLSTPQASNSFSDTLCLGWRCLWELSAQPCSLGLPFALHLRGPPLVLLSFPSQQFCCDLLLKLIGLAVQGSGEWGYLMFWFNLSPMQSPCHWVLGSFPVPGIKLCYSSFPLAAVSCHQFPEGEDVCSMGRQERRVWEEFLAPPPMVAGPFSGRCTVWTLFYGSFWIFCKYPMRFLEKDPARESRLLYFFGTPEASLSCQPVLAFSILLIFSLPLSTYAYASKQALRCLSLCWRFLSHLRFGASYLFCDLSSPLSSKKSCIWN